MLEIKDLSFGYSKRSKPILDGVSFTLGTGKVGVLLGKNGAGKSTLIKILSGILKPSGGSVTLDGEDLTKKSPAHRARLVSYVPQNIAFGALSVYDTVLLGRISRFGLAPGKTDRETALRVIEELGIEDLALRRADLLSGGEKQKVAIARALVGEPRLLILDEPTGNLDFSSEKLVLSEMRRIAAESGVTVLTAVHDLNAALSFGHSFFFIKSGRVVRRGGPEIFTEETVEECFGERPKRIFDKEKSYFVFEP